MWSLVGLSLGLFQDAASQTADLTVPCRPQLPVPISLVTGSSRVLHSSVPRTGKLQSVGTGGQMSPQHPHFFEAFCAQCKHTNPQVNPSTAPQCPEGQVPVSLASSRNPLEVHNRRPYSSLLTQELWAGAQQLVLYKPPRWYCSTLKCLGAWTPASTWLWSYLSALPFLLHSKPCQREPPLSPSTQQPGLLAFPHLLCCRCPACYLSLPFKCKPLESKDDILSTATYNCD